MKIKGRGFITTIVLIIIAIILLKYWLDIDVIKFLKSPEVKAFFLKIWEFIVSLWQDFIKPLFSALIDLIKNISDR